MSIKSAIISFENLGIPKEINQKIIDDLKKALENNRNSLNKIDIIKQKDSLIIEIDNWLKMMENYQNAFKSFRGELYQYYNKGIYQDKENRHKQVQYTSTRSKNYYNNKYNTFRNIIQTHIINGYVLLHKIREIFINREEDYGILIRYEETGDIIEENLKLNDILELQKKGVFNITNKYGTKNDVTQYDDLSSFTIGFDRNEFIKYSKERGQGTKYAHSELYEAILKNNQDNSEFNFEFLSYKKNKENIDILNSSNSNFEDTSYNRGNIYEVVEYLVNEKGYKTSSKLKIYKNHANLINKALRYAQLNSDAHTKGGDVTIKNNDALISRQLKNMEKYAASLVNSTSVYNGLKKLKDILQLVNKEEISKGLIDLFVKKIDNDKGDLTQANERAYANAIEDGIKKGLGL